jgi:uncharacterized Zn finger protein
VINLKCVYCGGIAEVVEEEKHKGKKYTAIFYRCNKCGEEFYTWGQIEENRARIKEAIKNVQKEKR